jgi:hypothetical protein
MLDTVHHLLDGTNVMIAGGVTDIGDRIAQGDPTCGWEGDPSMGLFVDMEQYVDGLANPYVGWFEVWGKDDHGNGYFVGRWPRCDADILRDLAAGHWKRGNPAIRAQERQAQRRAELDYQAAQKRMEGHDKLHHALLASMGQHYGGLTRHNLLGRR